MIIRNTIDKMCPLKEITIKDRGDPWLSHELIEMIRDKDLLRKAAKRSRDEEDWRLAKLARNEVKYALSNAKAEYIKDSLMRYTKDSKKFWDKISLLLPNKISGKKINLTDPKEDRQIKPEDTADYLNEFFCGIGTKLASKFKSACIYNGLEIDANINDISTDEEELLKLCKEIDITKASAIENISTRVIKDAFCAIPHILSRLMNLSLDQGKFPEKWKRADIVPLFKGGDPCDVNNFRPIPLLPLPGKLLEKIVQTRLTSFFELYDILNKKQGGVRAGHSTINTIAEFTDDIFNNLNNSQCTIATFIDLKKAFDTINRSILLKKLFKLGIRGRTLNWLTSYLENRTQRTLANGKISLSQSINCGVPQGSVLGPTLFLVYINDIDSELTESSVHLFADDTVLYTCAESVERARLKLQTDLNILAKWCESNQLTINHNNTKNMLLGSKKFTNTKKYQNLYLNS